MDEKELEEFDVDEMPAVKKIKAIYRTAQERDQFHMSQEELEALRDSCSHSSSSYAEEMTLDALNDFIERYNENQIAQEEENRKNRKLAEKAYSVSVAATIFGGASLIVAVIALVMPLIK